ncbi:hypothetical protein [Moraxella nonliquefaciens]|uniref:hypothetical protein n=1 Tax=Moraxella nonliquefaciens TaxID=478 RepID=UPI003EE20043
MSRQNRQDNDFLNNHPLPLSKSTQMISTQKFANANLSHLTNTSVHNFEYNFDKVGRLPPSI